MSINVNDEIVVSIIANAGDSRSNAIAAIEYAKTGNFVEAYEYLKQSREALDRGHVEHTKLITEDAREGINITLLVVHASNHLSVAEMTCDFAEQLVCLYDSLKKGGNINV